MLTLKERITIAVSEYIDEHTATIDDYIDSRVRGYLDDVDLEDILDDSSEIQDAIQDVIDGIILDNFAEVISDAVDRLSIEDDVMEELISQVEDYISELS